MIGKLFKRITLAVASRRFLGMFFLLIIPLCPNYAKETVVIVQVTDDNRMITAAGDTLALANVQAISINDPDSLSRSFALKARSFLENQVLNKSVFVEYTVGDSSHLVHVLKREDSFDPINVQILRKGYGYFVPKPNSMYVFTYRDAADYAKMNLLGIYKIKPFTPAYGKERVVIVQVTDDNRMITAAGDTLELANVQTISGNDPDTLRRGFALKVHSFLEKQVLNQSVFVEYAAGDSSHLVHVLKGEDSFDPINVQILRKGYGYFVPRPDSKYSFAYRDAADYAKTNLLGLYKKKPFKPILPPISKTSSALWLNAGIGVGSYFPYYDLSTNYRHHSWLFSAGYRKGLAASIKMNKYLYSFGYKEGNIEWMEDEGCYLTVGRSAFGYNFEAAISTGPAITRELYRLDEDFGLSDLPKAVHRAHVLGWVVKAQWLVHPLNAGPALGLRFDCNFTREAFFVCAGVNVALGSWEY